MQEEKIIKNSRFLNIKNIDIGIVFVAFAIGLYLEWDIFDITIFSVFIWALLNPIRSRYFVMVSIFFLAIDPFLLLLERKDQAEQFAIYAYYFLAMAVLMGIFEIWQEKNTAAKTVAKEEK